MIYAMAFILGVVVAGIIRYIVDRNQREDFTGWEPDDSQY